MLVKLAFAMQRLKKYFNFFCHDQQNLGGGTIFGFYGGDTEFMGGPPVPPPGKPCTYPAWSCLARSRIRRASQHSTVGQGDT